MATIDGATFEAWRKARGMTQEAAGEHFGVGRRTVIRWESGATPIPAGVAGAVTGDGSAVQPGRPAAEPGRIGELRPAAAASEKPAASETRPEPGRDLVAPARAIVTDGAATVVKARQFKGTPEHLADWRAGMEKVQFGPSRRIAGERAKRLAKLPSQR